jgi:hypothetical protein
MHTNPALRKSMSRSSASMRERPVSARVLSMLLTACLATGPLGPARANAPKGQKRVLVVKTQRADDVPGTVVGRVMGYVDTLLGIDGKLEVVAPAALAPAEVSKPANEGRSNAKLTEKGTLERAAEAAEQAEKAAQKKRWADALKGWTKSIALYEKGLHLMADITPYVRALTGRALAYFGQGFDDNGEEELAHVLAIEPNLQLEASAPANALGVIERVRARVKPAGVQLTVRSNVPRAVVFVNGRNVGEAPVVLGELARGHHIVRVVAADHEAYGTLVTIADASVAVDAALVSKPGEPGVAGVTPTLGAEAVTGLESFAASGDFGAAFQAAARGLAKRNQLDVILWTYVRKKGEDFELGAFIWEAAGGRVLGVEPAIVSGDLGGLQVTMLDLIERAGAVISGTSRGLAVSGRPPIYEPARVEPKEARVETKPPEPRETVGKPDTRESPKTPDPREVPRTPDPKMSPDTAPKNEKPETVLRDKPPEKSRVGGYEVPPMRTLPPSLPEPEDDGDEFYETWWFWTVLGSVAAGSAAAFVLTTSGDDQPRGFRTTVSW